MYWSQMQRIQIRYSIHYKLTTKSRFTLLRQHQNTVKHEPCLNKAMLEYTGCPKINETHKIANKYVDFNPIVYIFQI